MSTKKPRNSKARIAKARGALLAAAYGDALGWPNENRANSSRSLDKYRPSLQLNEWTRRAGGRFFAHTDIVRAGEYSDDTQLIICTARSLAFDKNWPQYLSEVELPLWTLYERGGGRATKQAASSWAAGRFPWDPVQSSRKAVQSYFRAGGNGVAMRILPHVLSGISSRSFDGIARDIVVNGLMTHGHPRALVGALSYGYSVWRVLRARKTLKYGEMLESAIDGVDSWGRRPDINEVFPSWEDAQKNFSGYSFSKEWSATIEECVGMLSISRDALSRGALAYDHEVLQEIGCFDKRVGGSGVVTSTAALFLASRHAADPVGAIVISAFLKGADTDTIASMVGAIVGAIHGIDWLPREVGKLQDVRALDKLAHNVTERRLSNRRGETGGLTPIKKTDLEGIVEQIENSSIGDTIYFGRDLRTTISPPYEHAAIAKNIQVRSWKLTTNDNFTLYVKKIRKSDSGKGLHKPPRELSYSDAPVRSSKSNRISVVLPVADVQESKLWFERLFGSGLVGDAERSDSLKNVLSLEAAQDDGFEEDMFQYAGRKLRTSQVSIRIYVDDIESVISNAKRSSANIISLPGKNSGPKRFIMTDPDGHCIEVIERS